MKLDWPCVRHRRRHSKYDAPFAIPSDLFVKHSCCATLSLNVPHDAFSSIFARIRTWRKSNNQWRQRRNTWETSPQLVSLPDSFCYDMFLEAAHVFFPLYSALTCFPNLL
jgi:hypothetical protein